MYAYVDETGNTGARLLDDEQPLFMTAALLTRSDFDQRFASDVVKIAESLGSDQIHASQLGVGNIENVSRDILKVLRKAGPTFFLARVEKRYVIATKMFDTLFDAYENKAVPWHIYNTRPLRIAMVFKLAFILDDELANQFWAALMERDHHRARTAMAAFCRELGGRLDAVPDERSREIFSEALAWAAANPEALEFVHGSKQGRKSHLPNMIGFGNLLAGIERQSNEWGRPVDVIKHDRQHEFAPAMRFWHELYSNAREEVVTLPLGEKMVLRKVFGSKLEISASKDSAGIQIIDAILWLFARSLRGEILPAGCQALLDYVYRRAYQDDFSFAGVGASAEELLDEIEQAPLSQAQLEKARALQQEIEDRRLGAMQAYAEDKAGRGAG